MITEPRRLKVALAMLLALACTSDDLRQRYLENQSAFLSKPTHPVIVIPGFGNARLYDPTTDRFVWGTPRSMVHREYEDDLDLPVDESTFVVGRDRLVPKGFVGSRGLINTGFQIRRALETYAGYAGMVTVFEYDWRRSSSDAARELESLVGTTRVDLVTHSAGALVALAFARENPSLVRRIVLIAPPLQGTLEAFRVLARGEKIVRREITPETAATFPFLFELLPSEPFLIDERGVEVPVDWDGFRPADLTRANAFDRLLRDARRSRRIPPNAEVHVIAGDCIPTARRALLRRDGSLAFYPEELRHGETALRDVMFEPGDGSIAVSSALAGNLPHELFCDGHHGIASDPNVQRAIIRILTRP